jgi:outer membrane protein W
MLRRRRPNAVPSRLWCLRSAAFAGVAVLISVPAAAQDDRQVFAGSVFGISALSADARSITSASSAEVSLYDARTGPAVNVFAGWHVASYFSLQANWMWNRNDLTLVSSVAGPQPAAFYEQHRQSEQHAFVADGLIYFRRRDSAIRPYLGTGLSVLHFSSDATDVTVAQGPTAPPGRLTSTRLGVRSHVGIDFRLSRHFDFRYSFSETISGNPISPSLTPPGTRGLMNFQNLFGVVGRF